MTVKMAQIISDLHDSEINGEIGWFCGGAWTARLGDPEHGYDAGATVESVDAAVEWLKAQAIMLYPDSKFAKRWGRGFA